MTQPCSPFSSAGESWGCQVLDSACDGCWQLFSKAYFQLAGIIYILKGIRKIWVKILSYNNFTATHPLPSERCGRGRSPAPEMETWTLLRLQHLQPASCRRGAGALHLTSPHNNRHISVENWFAAAGDCRRRHAAAFIVLFSWPPPWPSLAPLIKPFQGLGQTLESINISSTFISVHWVQTMSVLKPDGYLWNHSFLS